MTADTDGDGIADFFEINGIPCANQRTYYTDYKNPDTDGDGLLDGEELIVTISKISNTGYIYSFKMETPPNAGDYDDSGMSDYDEVNGTDVHGMSYYIFPLYGDIIDIPAGTVALGYPNSNCGKAFVAKETNQYFQYHASALIYANGEYWIKVNSQNEYDVLGYVNIDYIQCSERISSFINVYDKLLKAYDKYPNGSYFNDKITEKCTHHLQGLTTCYIDGSCGCGSYNDGTYSAIQCMGFAATIFSQIHGGYTLGANDANANTVFVKLTNKSDLKSFLKKIKIGSHIRLLSGSYAHSIIVCTIWKDKIEIYDANSDFKCGISRRILTYDEFLKKYHTIYTYNTGCL